MNGTLYGVGVGPGDPDLMSLKAKQILEKVEHVVVPVRNEGEESTALRIVKERVDLSRKAIHSLTFLMEGGRETFERCGKDAGDVIMGILRTGKDVAMISLGDISVYSTYMYLDSYVRSQGFTTEIIPGITSFSYAAALAHVPLMLGDEGLAIITPNDDISRTVRDFDNVVVMKSGRSMASISDVMKENNIPQGNAVVVSRGGMDGQYVGPIDNRDFNYFTTTIIKREIR